MREQLALNLLQIKTQQNNHRRKFDFGNLLENSIEFVRHPHGNTKIVYFVIDPITAAFHSKYWIFFHLLSFECAIGWKTYVQFSYVKSLKKAQAHCYEKSPFHIIPDRLFLHLQFNLLVSIFLQGVWFQAFQLFAQSFLNKKPNHLNSRARKKTVSLTHCTFKWNHFAGWVFSLFMPKGRKQSYISVYSIFVGRVNFPSQLALITIRLECKKKKSTHNKQAAPKSAAAKTKNRNEKETDSRTIPHRMSCMVIETI